MESRYTASTKLTLAFLAAVLAVQIYQAATRPIGSGEAYLYDRFVRPTARQVLASELPDRDVLYSLLEKRSVGLFHVSPFSVRLPALLFGALSLWSTWQIARRALSSGSIFAYGLIVLALIPFWLGWFRHADGNGAALALIMCGVWLSDSPRTLNFAGVCLGMAVVADLDFAIPVAVVTLVLLVGKQWSDWSERVLVPAVAVAVILLALPLSHAHAKPEITLELTEMQSARLQSALDGLRADAGGAHIRIGASPQAEPVVNFYRAQHRESNWERAARDYTSGEFDYYLLSAREGEWVSQRHLAVLYSDADFVLARRAAAAM